MYEAQLKWQQAASTRLELVTSRRGVDVYNDPLQCMNLGVLYWSIRNLQAAKDQFLSAIEIADLTPGARVDMRPHARANLAGIYAELGDWGISIPGRK